MAEQGMIYKAINAVMEDIGAVGKTSKNQQQGFMFRGIDAVMNAINPALIKHKVFVVPEILDQSREERTTQKGGLLIYSICKVKYTFFAEDGSSIEAVVIGEGMDSGDKATNKAMSIAFKYACFQVLCIPTEEMKDPDEEVHELTPKNTTKQTASRNQPKEETKKPETKPTEQSQNNLDAIKVATVNGELQRTGVSAKSMCAFFKVGSVEEFTTQQFTDAMDKLKAMPDRKKGN